MQQFGRAEVDTEHLCWRYPTATWSRPSWGQFKIKVDDPPPDRIEAKRGDKPFEGEIGVSPRVKDALSRAVAFQTNSATSYVGPEHFLIGLAEEGEGLAANLLPVTASRRKRCASR
ncbi:hypothetical protein J4732_16870 [Serratia marcescens]|uniref:Clp R domain-containing protein n=1 Tax=Serratia marcescens TaxID=615 RepID=A0A939SVE9_SERMA|nr:hypothetical protein [Serratia marcescens]